MFRSYPRKHVWVRWRERKSTVACTIDSETNKLFLLDRVMPRCPLEIMMIKQNCCTLNTSCVTSPGQQSIMLGMCGGKHKWGRPQMHWMEDIKAISRMYLGEL